MKKSWLFCLAALSASRVLADTINIPSLIETKSSEFLVSLGFSGGVTTTKVEAHRMTKEEIAAAKKKPKKHKWHTHECTQTACGEAILKTISQGVITPKEGNTLMACLDGQRKIIETSDLSQRISEIERTLKQRRYECLRFSIFGSMFHFGTY